MLLDTCALLWIAGGHGGLSDAALEQIEKSHSVYISAITGFEISLKYKKGKLLLPVPVGEWLLSVLEHHKISVIPLDLDICVKANDLPSMHQDPCDRLIIATSKIKNMAVVTADVRFRDYGIPVIS